MTHLFACFWYFVADQAKKDENGKFKPDIWVVRTGLDGENVSVWSRYVTSFYWACQTITTVGYGDIAAITTGEKLYAIFWMIIGVGFYSFTIGNLASIVQ